MLKAKRLATFMNRVNLGLKQKLIIIFLIVNVIPVIFLTSTAYLQMMSLGILLREKAVNDSTNALNEGSRENLERMTVDTARHVAEFLYKRDQDLMLLADLPRSVDAFKRFSDNLQSRITIQKEWVLSDDGMSWVEKKPYETAPNDAVSTNQENNDIMYGASFRSRSPEFFDDYKEFRPLYDEITYIDLYGNELIKYQNPKTTKIHYPMKPSRANISNTDNTYIRAENYFTELQKLKAGEIYVSDVIGAYVGTNYVGMYTPGVLKNVPSTHPNHEELKEIANLPNEDFYSVAKMQAFSGFENPIGQRFEGIIRWGTPIFERGEKVGYVTMALDHIHLMEFVDYLDPMLGRYTILPTPQTGNYAFIWDYMCRSICHPRHHSIVGYNPLTGELQVPWLEGSIAMERDYRHGGFLRAANNTTIPILKNGRTQPAQDTPFYYWFTGGGEKWLEDHPRWDLFNLSKETTGKYWWEYRKPTDDSMKNSWNAFYLKNVENRDILPQFGERILLDKYGKPVYDEYGHLLLDAQSRRKTPAMLLTKGGYVGLDGRYLNNAPQCTGWMNLTKNGGSGSFYILWSGIYKPITAGAIQYYTGKYHPTKQNNSKRGFAFVTLGAGIDDFTEPARDMEQHLTETISNSMFWITIFLGFTFLVMIVLLILMTIAISTYITDNIDILITGFSIFRSGCRRFRLRTNTSDEFGILANSFDEMADSIVNSQSGFVTIIDLEFKILYASDDSLLIWNISSSDTDGKSYHSVSIYPQNSKYDPILALAEGRESDIIYIAGANRYYKGQANYLLDEKSNKIGYIIITHDVSEIEDARIKAEQANIAKTTFLANMSHEIRTPMNSIMGVTEILMLNESLSHDTIDKLERIHNSCQLLLGIINDILDLSKIEAGKMDLFCSEYPIDMMIYSTAQLNIFRIQGKPIQFTLKVDENLPSHLIGDEIRIKQILNNILSNALKYTEKGFVTLSITAEPGKDPDDMILVFGTKDTGLGMTEEQLNRLFDPYSRFASNITKTIEGTGLGLFITNQLIRLMNGTIEVESQPGVGTNVVIKLPQKISKNQVIGTELAKHIEDFQFRDTSMNKKAKVQRVPMPYAKVLVVDDITTNLYVAKGLLAPYKMTIETVDSGIAAVDKIASGNIYDLILMDHMMPEMDGIEATKIIRELGYKKPIIALTANAVIGQADIFMQNGFDAFISKPIDVVSLDNNLMIWIRNKQNEDTLQKAEAGRTKSSDSSEGSNFELDPEMVQAFLSDAKASLITLKETIEKDNLKLFTITIHGMKSALAIIGQKEISQKASDLEEAGLKENTDFLSNHVDEFIRDLENIISDISKTVNEDDTIEPIEEDTNLLIAELQKIKAECETLNDEAIFSIIDMLQKQQWKKNTLQFINDIHNSIHLHSDFDTVIEMIDKKLQESL